MQNVSQYPRIVKRSIGGTHEEKCLCVVLFLLAGIAGTLASLKRKSSAAREDVDVVGD